MKFEILGLLPGRMAEVCWPLGAPEVGIPPPKNESLKASSSSMGGGRFFIFFCFDGRCILSDLIKLCVKEEPGTLLKCFLPFEKD